MAFERVEGFGDRRDDYRAATLATILLWPHSKKHLRPADLIGFFSNVDLDPLEPMSGDELRDMIVDKLGEGTKEDE